MDEIEVTEQKQVNVKREVSAKVIGLGVAVVIGMIATAVTEKINKKIHDQIVKDDEE